MAVVPATVNATEPAVTVAASPENPTPESFPVDPNDHWFATEHLRHNLRQRTVNAGMITLSAQAAKFFIRMGSAAVFARLLVPADFGLVAMVTVITGFVEMFKDAGLATATVQADRVTHAQVSTLFWINILVAGVAGAAIAALAPFIVWFYGDPRLMRITFVLGLTVLFSGLSVQYQALLRRRMEFGKLAITELASMGGGVSLGLLMAYRGWGYWSLVGMIAAGPVIVAICSYAMIPWRPGRPGDVKTVMSQLKFGLGLSGSSMVGYTRETFARLLIGWYYDAALLGIYSRAQDLIQLPIRQALPAITAVLVPALSRMQNEPERYRAAFRRIFAIALLMTYPLVLMCIGCAREVVEVLLGGGEKWMAAETVLQGFALLALAVVPTALGGTALATMGKSREMFKWNVVGLVITVIAVGIALPFGIAWIAFAVGASTLFLRTPTFFDIVTKATPLKKSDLWLPMFGLGGACVVGIVVAWLTAYSLLGRLTSIPRLGVSLTAGLMAYGAVVMLVPTGRSAVYELVNMVIEKRREMKRKQPSGPTADTK